MNYLQKHTTTPWTLVILTNCGCGS
jgi:hypothetical protein